MTGQSETEINAWSPGRKNPDAPQEENPDAVSILIVDDHALFRAGLRDLLSERGFEIAGEAADGEAAVEAAVRIAPTIVLMDLNMPKMHGIEATRGRHGRCGRPQDLERRALEVAPPRDVAASPPRRSAPPPIAQGSRAVSMLLSR
ncbi:MAG: response regulator [Solirubrobacterales bacterium]